MGYKMSGDTGAIPAALRWEVWGRDDFRCQACGSRMFLEVDHILPRAKGGRTVMDNLQTLCANCNARKRDHSGILLPGESCEDENCGHAPNRLPPSLPIDLP